MSQAFAQSKNSVKEFLQGQFANEIPKPERLWIDKQKQLIIKKQFNPSQIRISYRYWQNDAITVWVLDEIGKERNITTAIVIENNAIKNVEILVYRESRGGQVQNKRFTQQYYHKNLQSNFIKEIDSISGATLSVNALNKQVKLALWLNQHTHES
ncbi:MAG: FMN-binding protein [Alcanivoracaceae bacterium]|nr:FMN-binding protein [Alcanivoracaceae bacterium]